MTIAKQSTEHKSAVVQAIEARPRPTKIVEVNMAVGILAEPVHKVAFRVNTKREDNEAIDRAHRYLNETIGSEPAKSDPDMLTGAKLIAALWSACREVKTTTDALGAAVDTVTSYPAFPSPSWMHDHLTADQLGVLINIYNTVKSAPDMSPVRFFDADDSDVILTAASDLPEDAPPVLFAAFSREALVSLLVYAARALAAARDALAESERQPEGFRLVDVEHAALVLQSRAERAEGPAEASVLATRGQAIRDAVAVLRGQMPAEALAPTAPEQTS